jgi:hypothetical protein
MGKELKDRVMKDRVMKDRVMKDRVMRILRLKDFPYSE